MDLSNYVRVGRYELPEPTRTTAPAGSVLAQEASAVTYNWDTDTLFVTGDGGRSITEVSKTGQLISTMNLALNAARPQGTEFYDPEGLTYIGGGKFVMTEERDRNLVEFTYQANSTLTRANAKTVNVGPFNSNEGLEGLSFDPLTGGFIVVKEINPQGIFQTTVNFTAGTASNVATAQAEATNLFNPALLGVIDIGDVFALSNLPALTGTGEAQRLLVLSQESAKVLEVDRAGVIYSTLTLAASPGDTLGVAAMQHEGITMDRAGNIYIVNENGGGDINHPELWVYAPSAVPNQAPTAIALTNALTSLPENTATGSRVLVGGISITDDGIGTNNLAVTGADAAFFEVDSTGLYIKAGVTLDYETRTSYSVTVTVDDPNVGAAPDASVAFTLNVTDVVNENVAPTITISEVAPWSSGNSPVAADWFELTNNGTTTVDITGWKVDDSSHAFATAIALNGITSIKPGESVIFFESADLAATRQTFINTWFGGNAPVGLQFGNYSGGGIGLSTGGDEVNIYDSTGALKASVAFGAAATGPFTTFDNAQGINGGTITTQSKVGVYGGFVAANDAAEIGSPGSAGKLFISEVAPWSSSSKNSPVEADWFEVTNTTAFDIDVTGWKMDDNSESPAGAVALTGISTIKAGESVIYFETADLAGTVTKFVNTWFGGTAPAGLQFGAYTGSGVGLSTDGDAVNLYDTANNLRASVSFGASPTGTFTTFDNSDGANKAAITAASKVGVNGAFVAANDSKEIGSPGTIGKLFISEVAPWSSGNAAVGADWFEVTNGTDAAIDLTGWKIDDSSATFANGGALSGISTIAAGESVIFFETTNLALTVQKFVDTWFNGTAPAGLRFGSYTGGGLGLSTDGDAVNLYNAAGALQANVSFGASPTGTFATFDNSGAQSGLITKLSAVGVQGGFTASDDATQIGSPGGVITTNRAPVGGDDTASVLENGSVKISVLANDTDADGHDLTVTLAGAPAHGAAVVNGDGTITYTPTALYAGADSFTYTLADRYGGSDTVTVSINVIDQVSQTILTPNQAYGVQGFQGAPTDVFLSGTTAGAEFITIGDYTTAGFSNNFAAGGDTIRFTGTAANFSISVSGNQVTLSSTVDNIAVKLPVGLANTTIVFETAPLNFSDSRVLHFVADGNDADAFPDLFLGTQRIFPDVAAVSVFA